MKAHKSVIFKGFSHSVYNSQIVVLPFYDAAITGIQMPEVYARQYSFVYPCAVAYGRCPYRILFRP